MGEQRSCFITDAKFDSKQIHESVDSVIGCYKPVAQIGERGMGVVFTAEQTEPVQWTVALKIIKPGMDSRHLRAGRRTATGEHNPQSDGGCSSHTRSSRVT